jgi:hypothetical protein
VDALDGTFVFDLGLKVSEDDVAHHLRIFICTWPIIFIILYMSTDSSVSEISSISIFRWRGYEELLLC